MIQIFEAMGDYITESDFNDFALPCMQRIASELRQRHPDVPLFVFPRGSPYALVNLQQCGYDIVTLGTKDSRTNARKLLKDAQATAPTARGKPAGVQGNLDVMLLRSDESSVEKVQEATRTMLTELGPQNMIANLGEGLTGKEDPVLVNAFIDAVHEISEEMIKANK